MTVAGVVTAGESEPGAGERPGRLRGRSGLLAAGVPAAVAAALLSLNLVLTRTEVNLASNLLLLVSLALAWNLVAGFGGQFSLGHSIFIGLGAYLAAVLLVRTGITLIPAMLLAALLAAAVGAVLAYPMIRLRGPYFAIGTLALSLAAVGWMLNWDLTNRSQAYPLPAEDLLDVRGVYQLTAVVAIVTFAACYLTMRAPIGLRLLALRDDEAGATSLGVRRTATLLPVWALSAFLTGLVGAAYAVQKGTLDPQSLFSLQFTMDAIVVCVVGGLGTLTGPVVGGVAVFAMRQFAADYESLAGLMEALAVVLVVRFVPGGLVAYAGRLRHLVRGRAAPARDVADPVDIANPVDVVDPIEQERE